MIPVWKNGAQESEPEPDSNEVNASARARRRRALVFPLGKVSGTTVFICVHLGDLWAIIRRGVLVHQCDLRVSPGRSSLGLRKTHRRW